jgi:hypothetical protein
MLTMIRRKDCHKERRALLCRGSRARRLRRSIADRSGGYAARVASVSGAAVGVEAWNRLVRLESVRIEAGLTEPEFARIEHHFGFTFADDHRAFLAAGVPVFAIGHDDHPDKASWGWPDWRDLDSEDLHHQVRWPVDSALAEIRDGH